MCPKCRRTPLFVKPFDLSNPLKMHKSCSHCRQNFEPEPGFYYGAMFISYAISVFLFLPTALLLVFYFKWTFGAAMGFVVFLVIVTFMRVLRISRSLYIHIMVAYNPPS